ncbi:MAG: DUF4105 domain-containing protein [Clostridium sp.]|nr:DUF4105 domain-containing protein [Clostridium sp.]
MKLLRYILFCLLGLTTDVLQAVPADSLEVSLLTCQPGREVYELYGHTALRCRDFRTGLDAVFNYGVFNFDTPHFLWRFTKGECDYEVRAVDFRYFYAEYSDRGSYVVEQVLNLTTDEKIRLVDALILNCRPENRGYRYNYLYDNCTTRVRDRIEEAVDGRVVYPEGKARTYRGIIHEYTAGHPWAELGNDLCLGADVDTLIGVRAQMFAPFYLREYANASVILSADGGERPLVAEERYAVQPAPRAEDGGGVSPMGVFWGLLVLVVLLTAWEVRTRRLLWGLDALLLTGQGVAGLVVSFLFFFSEHPAVGSNWQILLFNPVPLVMMPRVVYCAIKGTKTRYHAVKIVWLTLFMLFSALIPQKFCVVIVPLAIILWIRSLRYIIYYKKRQSQCVQSR